MIDGATRLFAIVGDPIVQVKSPGVFNPLFAAVGRNAVLVPWHAPAAAFDVVMAGLLHTANLDGIIVTYPFKHRALAAAGRVGRMAECVGAVNALRREPDGGWSGDMFDGIGLVCALTARRQNVAGRHVKLLGAGGAGSAIAYALAEAGVAALSIYDTDSARAAQLAQGVAGRYPVCRVEAGNPNLDGADLLINATPVGLNDDDGLPLPLPDLSAATTVFDIVPRPGGTPLLAHAQARGCPYEAGAAMVAGQARAVLDFFGIPASA